MAQQRRDLAASLSSTDPNNSITGAIGKKQRRAALRNEIAALRDEKSILEEEIIDLTPQAVLFITARNKIIANRTRISEIDRRIPQLESELASIK